MISTAKTLLASALVLSFAMLSLGYVGCKRTSKNQPEIAYSDLFEKIKNGDVQDAVIDGNELHGHLKISPQMQFETILPPNHEELEKALLAARVNVTIKVTPVNSPSPLLINLIPLFVLSTVWLLTVPPFWVIFKKAGFQPVLSIVMLVPLANLIVLYIVAFSKWKGDPPRVA